MDSVGGARLGGGSDKFVADVEGTVFVTVGTVADEDPFSIGTEYPFSYTGIVSGLEGTGGRP